MNLLPPVNSKYIAVIVSEDILHAFTLIASLYVRKQYFYTTAKAHFRRDIFVAGQLVSVRQILFLITFHVKVLCLAPIRNYSSIDKS